MAAVNAKRNQVTRINRRLRKTYRKLCTSRNWPDKQCIGPHYLVDEYRNIVVQTHVDLDALERELPSR